MDLCLGSRYEFIFINLGKLSMKRVVNALKNNGIWGVYLFFSLLRNYVRVFFIRKMLGVSDIYFQGAPRIINRKGIRFGKKFQCGKGAWIESVVMGDPDSEQRVKIEIGNNFTASEYLHIGAVRSVSIGENVLVGSHVLITDHSHGTYGKNGDDPRTPPNRRTLSVKGSVVIGNNVWICDGVKILSGVTIGEGSVIGANSVVREDIPEYCIYSSSSSGEVIRRYNVIEKKWVSNE